MEKIPLLSTLAAGLLLAGSVALAAPKMEMVKVPGGCFQMGDTFGDGDSSEKPAHEVCVRDFFLGKYEVTQTQWQEVMGENPSTHKSGGNYPVEMVSWDDVQKFITRLNQQTGKEYRLPTEAEWEFAARSGGRKEKWAGVSDPKQLFRYMNICDVNCSLNHRNPAQNDGHEHTAPVGSYLPNGLGIYDMSGNVWEWVQDWYDESYYHRKEKSNPRGPEIGNYRVLRGGSWPNDPSFMRASKRYKLASYYRYDTIGFRLASSAR